MEKNKVGKRGCSYRHGDLTERMSVRPNEDGGISTTWGRALKTEKIASPKP